MLTYSNYDDNEDEAINAILDNGMKDLERIQRKTKRPMVSKITKKKKGQSKPITSTKQISASVKAKNTSKTISIDTSNADIKQSYVSQYALTEGRDRITTHTSNILNKTRAVLHYKTNKPTARPLSKRSRNHSSNTTHTLTHSQSNHQTELLKLEQETNVIWKAKYDQLKEEYSKVTQMNKKEQEKNNLMLTTLNQLKKKEADIPKLLHHQTKLDEVNSTLHSHYKRTENKRQLQLATISNLQAQLKTLRLELHDLKTTEAFNPFATKTKQ